MKKVGKGCLTVVLFIVVIAILVSMCTGDSDDTPDIAEEAVEEVVDTASEDVEASEEEEEEPVEDNEVEEEEEVEQEYGNRSNPVPLGTTVTLEDSTYDDDNNRVEVTFDLTITDVIRGDEAFAILEEENMFNEPAPEGMEWVIVTLDLELLTGDDDYPFTVVPFSSVMDSTGSEVSQDDYGTFDGNEFGYVDLFPGGTHSGRESFYVPVDDDALYVYEVFLGSSIYFDLK